jgi:hypothetical protein
MASVLSMLPSKVLRDPKVGKSSKSAAAKRPQTLVGERRLATPRMLLYSPFALKVPGARQRHLGLEVPPAAPPWASETKPPPRSSLSKAWAYERGRHYGLPAIA